MNRLNEYIVKWLTDMGVAAGDAGVVSRILIVLAIVLLVIASYHFCHKILVKVVRRITSRTSARWDDHLFGGKVLDSVCHLLPPLVLYVLLPLAFADMPEFLEVLKRSCFIYIVVVVLRLICAFISALYRISCEKAQVEQHPLKGVYQMLKLIFIILGVIVIISVLVDKSPVVILAGLGAVAAALTFVFQDTILGLVAGVQLTANDMLKPGDWIVAPKYGADGFVIDVTLTTVKVRNWDMTITTVPPYALVSDSFQNWRGMFDSGGRRVKRSINIDVNSIRFCTLDELARFEKNGWLDGIDDVEGDMVNLRVFRNYLERYIRTHSRVNQGMMQLVRQLQPTQHGLPLELYFFTSSTQWVVYEKIQASVFEHVYAMLPEFGLRVHQSPSGVDLQSLSKTGEAKSNA